jgi:8-oxo-dGTP diphosphatase
MVLRTTLCYLVRDGKFLLQHKSKGLFGEGKWNGPGGKLQENEAPIEGAKREIFEETSVRADGLEECGLLNFFKEGELFITCRVFKTQRFEGEPKDSREGKVKWFAPSEMPYDMMWPDDRHWMPLLFEGKKFQGDFMFDSELKEIKSHKIKVI